MKRLWLLPEQARAILRHAQEEAPREACGVLAGRGEKVQEVIPLPNAARDPVRQYRLDDAALVRVLYDLNARQLEVLGYYHSHPAGSALPSPTDIREAAYPDAVYVIAGLGETPPGLSAWRLRYGNAEAAGLHVSEHAPAEDAALTPAQQRAVLISALIVTAFMIMLSLSLLPPAPPIPR